jgi:hypothetical protein
LNENSLLSDWLSSAIPHLWKAVEILGQIESARNAYLALGATEQAAQFDELLSKSLQHLTSSPA